jgi:8-oxo-dGTP pyrophosphatase MutT (NUDIX family)
MSETNYYDTLPKKHMGSGFLLFNKKGEILVVEPNYKEGWEIAGGVVDEGESPLEAAKRELLEELGLTVDNARLLVCDYWPASDGRPDNLMFIFDGGTLSDEEIDSIKLQTSELKSYRFLPHATEAERQAIAERPRLGPRLLLAIEAHNNGHCLYLETAKKAA